MKLKYNKENITECVLKKIFKLFINSLIKIFTVRLIKKEIFLMIQIL